MDINSLFLGAKSENDEIFSKELVKLFYDHAQWRKN